MLKLCKRIALTEHNYLRLRSLGKMGESFNFVLEKLLYRVEVDNDKMNLESQAKVGPEVDSLDIQSIGVDNSNG